MPTALWIPIIVAPGIVLTMTYRANRPGKQLPDLHVLALSLILSIPVHAILLPWTQLVLDDAQVSGWRSLLSGSTALWAMYLFFAVPVTLGVLVSRASEWDWFARGLAIAGWTEAARTLSAWQWAFIPETPGWLLITFRNGALMGGKYGDGAFAGLQSEARDLYLLNPHVVNENGTWVPSGASGAWIDNEEIALVEFFESEESGDG